MSDKGIGKVYTPPGLANTFVWEVASVLREAPAVVFDPCAGGGALLAAAEELWPGAIGVGCDIQPTGEGISQGDLFKLTAIDADVVLINPPYVGRSKLRATVGDERFKWLKSTYGSDGTGNTGAADLAGYVVRHTLEVCSPRVKAVGVLATNTLAQGSTRRVGLRWATANGWCIPHVVKGIEWPTEDAAVTVDIVIIARREYFNA